VELTGRLDAFVWDVKRKSGVYAMARLAFLFSMVVTLALYTTALVAQSAPQPGQTAPATKAKPQAPRKKDQPRVEGSYASEAEAKKACADGSVVWVNSRSRIYHAAATRDYGKTRQGFYMCQAQAERSGFRAVKGPPENTRKKAEKKV